MTGLLSRIGDPEFERECAASCAAQDELERKREHIDTVLQKLFAQAIDDEYRADHEFSAPEFERHFAELEQYRAFCRREGLPDTFPCNPYDACAYLFDCARSSLAAVHRAYRALEREHRRCGDPSMSDVRVRVFMRGIRNLNVKKKSTIH